MDGKGGGKEGGGEEGGREEDGGLAPLITTKNEM